MAASKADYEAVAHEELQKEEEEGGGGGGEQEESVDEGGVEHGFWSHGSKLLSDFPESVGRQFKRGASTTVPLFFVLLFIGAFFFIRWFDVSLFSGTSLEKAFSTFQTTEENCTKENTTCSTKQHPLSGNACPDYFRWIYEDLRPWAETGITQEMMEAAKDPAFFRLVILDGKVYMEKYKGAFQTRDVFTIWGILQLLKLYPGKVPDLELMFECGDRPRIKASEHGGRKGKKKVPPLFHYCASDDTLDIVFPDWSFWGWPEINIKPWNSLRKELEEGNNRTKWMDREPYAYWKGNIRTSGNRQALFKCRPSNNHDWNARVYDMDWGRESHEGFKDSNLASQCTHKYKIYMEGIAWSVSEKYILACDSMSLVPKSRYYDFFTRSLQPTIHYWPIQQNDICRSVKYAVDWGNKHPQKAQKIGKAASNFVLEELKMNYVYDYMFHLLSEYAKLFKYKPTVPPGAIEIVPETMANTGGDLEKIYKNESSVKGPATTSPCTMPPPYDPKALKAFLKRKDKVTRKVEKLEASGNLNKDISP